MFGASWIKPRIIFHINSFIAKSKIDNFKFKGLINILLKELFLTLAKYNIILEI